jgi:glucose-1-phosphate thymidylyltransferase
MIACLEEIAFRMNYITAQQLRPLAAAMGKSSYGDYLRQIVEQDTKYAVR